MLWFTWQNVNIADDSASQATLPADSICDFHYNFDNWIQSMQAMKIVNEPLGAEPKTVEDQLGRAKALNNDVVANERLVKNVKLAAASLLSALDGDVTEVENNNLETIPLDIEERYNKLASNLADKCQLLDNALVQSQGVQEALDSLATWLAQAENQFK